MTTISEERIAHRRKWMEDNKFRWHEIMEVYFADGKRKGIHTDMLNLCEFGEGDWYWDEELKEVWDWKPAPAQPAPTVAETVVIERKDEPDIELHKLGCFSLEVLRCMSEKERTKVKRLYELFYDVELPNSIGEAANNEILRMWRQARAKLRKVGE
jgi:hypothetical protein